MHLLEVKATGDSVGVRRLLKLILLTNSTGFAKIFLEKAVSLYGLRTLSDQWQFPGNFGSFLEHITSKSSKASSLTPLALATIPSCFFFTGNAQNIDP